MKLIGLSPAVLSGGEIAAAAAEIIILSEVKSNRKHKYYMISLICGI